MKTKLFITTLLCVTSLMSAQSAQSIYDITVKARDGKDISLEQYKGKVLLIVNTATKCGYTKQYSGLEELYKKYAEQGFEILDFPCNQFLGQAPGTADEINDFCTTNYGITFTQFEKINVNGKNESPLYTWLKSQKKGNIKWNFTKFLIAKDGTFIERYETSISPEKIDSDIAKALSQ